MSSDGAEIHAEDALQVAQRALVKLNDLEERYNNLEERIAALEGDGADGDRDDGLEDLDHRDRAVVECLEPGQTIQITELRSLYRRHTDIRSERTLKERLKGLVARPEFFFSDIGEITYDPEGGESA